MDPYIIEDVGDWWRVEREIKNACNTLVGKFESKRQFWIQRHN